MGKWIERNRNKLTCYGKQIFNKVAKVIQWRIFSANGARTIENAYANDTELQFIPHTTLKK